MLRFAALLVLGLPLLGLALHGQGRKAEVFGLIGIGATGDDEGSLGKGVNGGGGVGWRLTRRIGVEGEINAFRSRREFGGMAPPFEHSGVHAMGNVLAHFGSSRAQFYVLGGVGLLHVRNAMSKVSSDGLNLGVGVGMKLFATEHVYVRPDFRVFAGDGGRAAEKPFTVARFAIGAGYAW